MARMLAVLDAFFAFFAASAMTLLWTRTAIGASVDVATAFRQAAVVTLCSSLAFYYNDLYDLRLIRNIRAVAPRLVQSILVAAILLTGCYIVFPKARLAAWPLLSSFVILGAVVLSLRALIYAARRKEALRERVLLLGASELTVRIVEEIEAQPHLGYDIVGVVGDGGSEMLALQSYIIGSIDRFAKLVKETRARRIIIALPERRGRLPVTDLLECQAHEIIVEDGVEAFERLTGKVPIQWVPPSNLLFSGALRRARRYDRMAGALTWTVGLAGLLVTVPLLVLVAMAIKLDSRGPLLFVQERIGLFGRPFRLLKFRTMVPDPRPLSEWACDNSARITRVGKWLRRSRLDELPQLINILRGEMAFVGPRPHPASNYALFADRIPHYAVRLHVRPGVTGWSQVRYGYANNLEEEVEKMRFDLYYIKHLSVSLDLRILFDTVKILAFGRGATTADAYGIRMVAKRTS